MILLRTNPVRLCFYCRYKIDKLHLTDKYVLHLSVAVCLEPDSCELDVPVLSSVMIPIMECNLTMPARVTGQLSDCL